MADQKNPEQEKLIRLVWGPIDDVPVHYANHMSVSFAGGTEFHITFGHLVPPLANIDAADIPEKLTIKPITIIVTSPAAMSEFVKVLKNNLESFEKIILEMDKK